ncbi:hypothetical protein PENTCL1PPCAC_8766, partial [Pristionchus entomophagus]
ERGNDGSAGKLSLHRSHCSENIFGVRTNSRDIKKRESEVGVEIFGEISPLGLPHCGIGCILVTISHAQIEEILLELLSVRFEILDIFRVEIIRQIEVDLV